MSGKTESAKSVSMSANTRMIIMTISAIFATKRLANTPEEKRLVLQRQSAQLAVSHMEKLIQVIIQEQRNGFRPKRSMKRSGTAVI